MREVVACDFFRAGAFGYFTNKSVTGLLFGVATNTLNCTSLQRWALFAGSVLFVGVSVLTLGAWYCFARKYTADRILKLQPPNGMAQGGEKKSVSQWNDLVEKVFPKIVDMENKYRLPNRWFREIFLATFQENTELFLLADENFLRKVRTLMEEDKVIDALLLPVPGTELPIIYWALCEQSNSLGDSRFCSDCAYLLMHYRLKNGERERIFAHCVPVSPEKTCSIIEIIVGNLNPAHCKNGNSYSFLFSLRGNSVDECLRLLSVRDSFGKGIVDYVRTAKDEDLIDVYKESMGSRGFGPEYQL
jgi:hypothetical protein